MKDLQIWVEESAWKHSLWACLSKSIVMSLNLDIVDKVNNNLALARLIILKLTKNYQVICIL